MPPVSVSAFGNKADIADLPLRRPLMTHSGHGDAGRVLRRTASAGFNDVVIEGGANLPAGAPRCFNWASLSLPDKVGSDDFTGSVRRWGRA